MKNAVKIITILYLYPQEMNTYGDWGNVLVLQKRLEWRGYKVKVVEHRPGDKLPAAVDIIFFGGGQDSGQSLILDDLMKHKEKIATWVEAGTPMLAICGGYQLLGKEFITSEGERLPGLAMLDLTTRASQERLIGNVIIETEHCGKVIGFENHSGRTTLGPGLQPFGHVVIGAGNNGKDAGEGVVYKSTVGTYLHGPLLPKNPEVADWLIARALGVSNKDLVQLSDKYVVQARERAERRQR